MAGADLGRTVRRSGHCLPSDSDKFTIKLHSLPSKFPFSSSFAVPPLPPLTPSSPSHPPWWELPLLCGHRGLLRRNRVVYSLAITIIHYTPAPSCPPSSLAVILCPLCVVPRVLHFLSSYRFAVFSISLSSLLFAFLPSPSPFLLRLFCRIRHGYSAIVFDLSCSCCGCSREFRVPSVTAEFLLSFSPSFLFYVSPSPSACCPALRLASISRSIVHLLSRTSFSPFVFFALSFILEMRVGIYETKLMITTSKYPATTYQIVYIQGNPF